MRKLFGTDGIRGIANEYPLTINTCQRLVNAVAVKFFESRKEKHLVIIGKDTRISCDMFEHSIAAFFCALGADVRLLGIVPTPAISVLTQEMAASAGIMISASHNPFHDNGIKLFNKQGLKLSDKEEEELEEIMASDFHYPEAINSYVGRITSDSNRIVFYCDKIKNSFNFKNTKTIKIVVDSANGSCSHIAPKLLREFGFDVISIHDSPNGLNINDNCGVICHQILSEAVIQHNANLGIAFDGDGDRVIISDENGNILNGDHILAILAKSIKESSEIVSTIMSNFGLEEYLLHLGIKLTKTNVGDRYISEYLQKSDAMLGGEPSGHIIIKSFAPTGDGLFACLKVLEYLLESGKKCSQLRFFEPLPTINKNIPVHDKSIILNHAVAVIIRNSENQLKGQGKLTVRPSGTEPVIRISVEGKDPLELQKIADDIYHVVVTANKGTIPIT